MCEELLAGPVINVTVPPSAGLAVAVMVWVGGALVVMLTLSTAAGGAVPPLPSFFQKNAKQYVPALIFLVCSLDCQDVCRLSFPAGLAMSIQPLGVVFVELPIPLIVPSERSELKFIGTRKARSKS